MQNNKKFNMLHGELFICKDKSGLCCECGEFTYNWSENANDYFCTHYLCFQSRKRYFELKQLENKVNTLIEKLSKLSKDL